MSNRFVSLKLLMWVSALTLTTLPLTVHIPVFGQGTASEIAENEARRDRALADLSRIQEKLPAEMQADLPLIREAIIRFTTDNLHATQSDEDFYMIVRRTAAQSEEGRSASDILARYKKTKEGMRETADTQNITVGENKRPGISTSGASKSKIGYVRLKTKTKTMTIAEIPSSAGKYSPKERAELVGKRVTAAIKANPLWFRSLKPGVANDSKVVLCDDAPDGYLITADPAFARLRGTTPDNLSKQLSYKMRTLFDEPSGGRSKSMDPSISREDAAEEAALLREKGDAAYEQGDKKAAIQAYRAALVKNPTYTTVYESLAGVYMETGNIAECRILCHKALTLKDLTPGQRAAFLKGTK